jgi:hypothetical protein
MALDVCRLIKVEIRRLVNGFDVGNLSFLARKSNAYGG